MAEKKKFEKPEMQVIQLKAQMRMMAGSCIEHCDSDYPPCELDGV